MGKNFKHLYVFGPFRVDAGERLLLRDSEVVPLTPKAFDLLLTLLERPGRLLEKETLLQAVWPDSFVEENNLADNISRLRKALGEGENGQKFIETVPRRGYRFVASVKEVGGEEFMAGAPDVAEVTGLAPSSPKFAAGASAIEVIKATLKEEPPELGEPNAKTGGRLEKPVQHGPEKQPQHRFQPAYDLGHAREALPTSSGARRDVPGASPFGLFGQARLAWIMAALFLLVALTAIWAYFTRQPAADARVFKTSILPPEKSNFSHIAVSPDGTWLAFTAATGGKVQLWVRSLASSEAKPFDGTEGASHPFWSPDSRFIGFFAGGKLKKVEVGGGLPATLCDVGVGSGGTWNRTGTILFSTMGGHGLSEVPATGGTPTTVLRADRQETNFHDPSFLPDGRHFLYFVMGSGAKEVRGIYVSSLDGGARRKLLGDDSNALYAPSGQGGGYLLFGREGALMAQPFDAETLQLGGEAFPVAGPVGTMLGSTISYRRWNFSASANGVLVFDPLTNRQRSQPLWVDRSGKTINSLVNLDGVRMLSLAPDDRRFLVDRTSPQNTNNDIWLSDVTSGAPVRFTFDPGNDQSGIWSPDGGRIVWSSNRSGNFDLYEKDAGSTGQEKLLLQSDYFMFPTDWSRDGRYILYRKIDPQVKYDLWVLPLFGERKPFPFLQTEANEAAGVFSPDGRWIAYCSDESGRYEVYVESFPERGGKLQISPTGGGGPRWRGDGKELYYQAPDGKLMAVPVTDSASLAVGAPAALFEFRPSSSLIAPYYSVSRDGKRFLLSTIVETEPNAPLTVVVNWTSGLRK